MKIKTYIAKDMRQALRQVREEQGLERSHPVHAFRARRGRGCRCHRCGRHAVRPGAGCASSTGVRHADGGCTRAASGRAPHPRPQPWRQPRWQDAPSQLRRGTAQHATSAGNANGPARLERPDAPVAGPGRTAQGTHRAGTCRAARQRTGNRSVRKPRVRRGAPPMPGGHGAAHLGHRRHAAGFGRQGRLRRPDRCRQDHRRSPSLPHAGSCATARTTSHWYPWMASASARTSSSGCSVACWVWRLSPSKIRRACQTCWRACRTAGWCLIDTAGSSPRDPELAARARQFSVVADAAGIEICLTLSAGAQAGVLQEAVQPCSRPIALAVAC